MWCKVVSGFSGEDETKNFGTRNFAENNGSIYESYTVATIQSNDEVKKSPKILSGIHNNLLCVVIDNCLTIFDKDNTYDVLANFGFDSVITSYCFSIDCKYLFITLENGLFYCFNTENNEQLFSIDIIKDNNQIVNIFFYQHPNDKCCVTIVTTLGTIFRIDNINQLINKEIKVEEHQNFVNTNLNTVFKQSKIQYAAEIVDPRSTNLSIVTLGEELIVDHDGMSQSLPCYSANFKKVQFFKKFSGMICLDYDGGLTVMCLKTLISTRIWDGPIKDFVTLDEGSDTPQMVLLMDPKDQSCQTQLNLVSFPDFNIIFTMSVSTETYLIENFHSQIDNIIFLEGIKNNLDIVSSIRLKTIEESLPEFRLDRLLRNGRIEQAEEFARKFNLSTECIYQREAQMLMDRLQPQRDSGDRISVERFIQTLDKIKDVRYIYNCCTNCLTHDYKDKRILFAYTCRRIEKYIDFASKNQEEVDVNISNLLQQVSQTLRKLDTFEIIQKARCNNEVNEIYDIREWIKFSTANLLGECIQCLKHGEIDAAGFIWIRHKSLITPEVNLNTVELIFNAIPINLSPDELWPWLNDFIPSIMSILPNCFDIIIEWGYNKTKSLEKYFNLNWPNIGIQFVNDFMKLLSAENSVTYSQLHQQYANKNLQFHQLMILLQAMTDLLNLKRQHQVLLPLNVYLGNSLDVVKLLLDSVDVECISELIQHFLQQYMVNHSLHNDEVLVKYIKTTLNKKKNWWLCDKAPWDKRLSVVINHIHNIQIKLQQTLEVLKIAPVPWSDTLVSLAERSYAYNHPLVLKIRCECDAVKTKIILKKYGFAQISICSKLFSFIIKQDHETMVDDILELTKTDETTRLEVFYELITYHLTRGNIDRVISIMDQLDDSILMNCYQHIINVMKVELNKMIKDHDRSLENYFEVLGPIENRLRRIFPNFDDSAKSNELLDTISILRNLNSLKKDFGIVSNFQDYIKNKEVVLDEYINESIEAMNDDDDLTVLCQKVDKVNNLLNLPKLFGLYKLLEYLPESNSLKHIVVDQLSVNEIILPEESYYTNKICSLLTMALVNDVKLAANLKKLCSYSLINSDVKELPGNLFIANQIDAYNEAVGSEIDEIDEIGMIELYPMYKDASSSSGNILLPFYEELLKISLFYEQTKKYDLLMDTNKEKEYIELLCNDQIISIQNEHHDFSCLKIITFISNHLNSLRPISEKVIGEIQSIQHKCIKMMMKKLISNRVFDIHLGLTCLFMLSKKDSFELLKNMSQYFQKNRKDKVIKDLGYEYCRLINDKDNMELYQSQRMLHEWAKKLKKYSISYQQVIQSDFEIKRNILYSIMKYKNADIIDVLNKFCIDFGFDIGDCFLNYLDILLTTWEPKYTIPTDFDKKLKIDENHVNELKKLCNKVIEYIDDKERLKSYLIEMKLRINFYHYEIFLILFDYIKDEDLKVKPYLYFLKNYIRVDEPTDIERENWIQFSNENHCLPEISKWRLPYLPGIDQTKIITPELNLDTYERWLSIGSILDLNPLIICPLAIKGSVVKAWKNVSKTGWAINSRNTSLLNNIKKCTSYMKGVDALHYATAAWYFVMNNTPPGADQVAAAKECYVCSQEWQKQNESVNGNDDKTSKIKEKYFKYTTIHILHSHGLGQEEYLKLTESPVNLVKALYHDKTIPQRYKDATGSRPDIDSAVKALSEVHSQVISLTTVCLELLNEWLETGENFDEETMVLNPPSSLVNTNDHFNIDDNLLRACYISSSPNTEEYCKPWLIATGFTNDTSHFKPEVTLRALQVLRTITKVEEQNYKILRIKDINHDMKSLQYLAELSKLGLQYTINGFKSCLKEKLIQTLINHQYSASQALSLVPEIYFDFNINNPKLLNAALKCMNQLLLVKQLKKTLSMIRSSDCIANYSGFIEAWQIIIDDAFKNLNVQSTSEVIDALKLIHSCPITDKLTFVNIIDNCLRSNHFFVAAALLPFLNDQDKHYVIQKINESQRYDEIKEQLSGLASKGLLIVRSAMMMLNSSMK